MRSNMKIIISLFILLSANAKLIDKISAVFDSEIITLSMIKRIQTSLPARRNISPFIYKKSSYTNTEVVDLLVRGQIIRSKLAELGYVISDEQVEGEIKTRESKLGLTRNQLLMFLKNNNTNYEEFFEITREALEFNIFNSRVIVPLISISEQEIKNEFFKQNQNNKTIAYKYTLVDFTFNGRKLAKKEYKEFRNAMIEFQKGASLPAKFNNVTPTEIGDVNEESLDKSLQNVLKKVGEGQFSRPTEMFGNTHIFFVKKRDIVDSEFFTEQKPRIKAKLFEKKLNTITRTWFQREESNHYVKKFL